jgi:hypothetical protein
MACQLLVNRMSNEVGRCRSFSVVLVFSGHAHLVASTRLDRGHPESPALREYHPPGLSLWSRFWERLKHFVRCRSIFFVHEQLIIRTVIPDRCENACRQKRALLDIYLGLACRLV